MKPVLCLILLSMLWGCIALPIPNDDLVYPGAKGIVKDELTGEPVPSVLVKLTMTPSQPLEQASDSTNENGEFYISPKIKKSSWYIKWLLPLDPFGQVDISYSHPNYMELKETQTILIGSDSGEPYVIDLYNVYLKKMSNP